ncbi:MAG: bile acid:sodium symporter family protein [Bacteroidetes bacterium]|nr:MAG: bile acid:sodium symporter family protein [Bacteroidota bacterium]
MNEILQITFKISVSVFVIGSMLGMGLGLTVKQIVDPLKDAKLVILSLIANFIIVPLFVYGITMLLPLSEGYKIGLILLSISAGAPFLPKLADIAKSNVPFSIGLMLLLMVVTIFYLPLVLPFLLKGAEVSSWEIAKSLIIMMLSPLIIALLVRAYAEKIAKVLKNIFEKLTNIALILLTISLVALNAKHLVGMFGMPLVAILLLLIGAMLIGYFLSGKDKATKIVSALGTGQRNISAAILVATQNFKDPEVTIMLVAVSIFGLFIMMPYAKKMGTKQISQN